jgi:hypothetical protein
MELLGDMPYTFRMGSVGMGVKPNIVKIGGSPFGYLSYELSFGMGRYFGMFNIPGVNVGHLAPQRDGKIKGFGQVDIVYFGVEMNGC